MQLNSKGIGVAGGAAFSCTRVCVYTSGGRDWAGGIRYGRIFQKIRVMQSFPAQLKQTVQDLPVRYLQLSLATFSLRQALYIEPPLTKCWRRKPTGTTSAPPFPMRYRTSSTSPLIPGDCRGKIHRGYLKIRA